MNLVFWIAGSKGGGRSWEFVVRSWELGVRSWGEELYYIKKRMIDRSFAFLYLI